MKKIFLFISICLFFNCRSIKKSNDNNIIVYVLPTSVEKIVKERLENNKLENRYFDLQREKDYYAIYFTSYKGFFSKKTNRKLIIGKKVYPLIFDYDSEFATAEDLNTILKRLSKPQNKVSILRKVSYPIYDNIYVVKFKKNGDIIYKGSSW